MVKLFCRIVGAQGNAFPVDIDKSYSVGQLKTVIAEKKKCESGGDKIQLFLAKKDDIWLGEARAAAVMLDEDDTLRGFGDPMGPALRLKDPKYFGEEFQPLERRVHVLVAIPRQKLSANPSLGFPKLRRHPYGLQLKVPHLSRDELVMKLYEYVTDTNLVLLSSPPGTGKSSLLTLFGEKYAETFRLKTIAFYDPKADATALLNAEGIDIANRTCHLSTDKSWVFMLIECQRQYQNVGFGQN